MTCTLSKDKRVQSFKKVITKSDEILFKEIQYRLLEVWPMLRVNIGINFTVLGHYDYIKENV